MTMLIINIFGSKNAVNVPDRGQCEDLNKYHKVAGCFFSCNFDLFVFQNFLLLKKFSLMLIFQFILFFEILK